jgi:hypothetical protein
MVKGGNDEQGESDGGDEGETDKRVEEREAWTR